MSQSATEGTGQESGTSNGTQGQGQESTQGGTTGQESGGQGNQSTQQGQQGQGNESQTPSLDGITDPTLRAYVEKQIKDAAEARTEAARYRTERNTLTEQVQTFQRQNETDQERVQREAQEATQRMQALEAENRRLKVGTAITTAATDAKAFNPALVAQMLDAKVTLDDQGNPTNLQDLLKDLRQSDPYLFKRAEQDGGQGTGQQQQTGGSMNDLIRGQVAARRGRTT